MSQNSNNGVNGEEELEELQYGPELDPNVRAALTTTNQHFTLMSRLVFKRNKN